MSGLRTVGVPYSDEEIANAQVSIAAQSKLIADDLRVNGFSVDSDKEIVAMIAYLQRMGTDIKTK